MLSKLFDEARTILEQRPFYDGKNVQVWQLGTQNGPLCLVMALAAASTRGDDVIEGEKYLRRIICPGDPLSVSLTNWSDTHGKAAVMQLLAQARDAQRIHELAASIPSPLLPGPGDD